MVNEKSQQKDKKIPKCLNYQFILINYCITRNFIDFINYDFYVSSKRNSAKSV